MSESNLPDYRVQSEAVRDRFARIKKRPVTMEVAGLSKTFQSRHGTVTVSYTPLTPPPRHQV